MILVLIVYISAASQNATINLDNANVHGIDGNAINLGQYQGSPLLVSFWATSCAICLQEIPHLIELYHELRSTELEIIGIAMHYDPPDLVIDYAQDQSIPYPIALDISGDAVAELGGIELTPTNLLFDRDGILVQRLAGKINISKLKEDILSL